MKRNQYTLLAEKYQNIQENDKEDVLAGLEELEFNPEEPITKDNIKRLGFELSNDHGVRNFYTIPGDDSKIGLKCDYYIKAGYAWSVVDGLNIRKYYVRTLGELQNKYNEIKALNAGQQVVQEDDKEDVLTGLESLESEQYILKAFINAKSVEEIIDITDRHYEALKNISDQKDFLSTIIHDYNTNLYLTVAWAALLIQRYKFAKWRKYHSFPEDPDLAERIELNKQEIYDYYRLYLRDREEPKQELQEDDKEDIMAGLEELGDIPQAIYGIDTEMCRGEYDRGETRVWGPDEIYKIYFEDEDSVNYYSDFTSNFRPYTFEAFIDKIKTGGGVTISGEETAESFCINKERLEKEIDDWERENGYEEELDESDKEDIMSGLDELESWSTATYYSQNLPVLKELLKHGYRQRGEIKYDFSGRAEEDGVVYGFIYITLTIPQAPQGVYLVYGIPAEYHSNTGPENEDTVVPLDIDHSAAVVDNLKRNYYIDMEDFFYVEDPTSPSEVIQRVEDKVNTIKQNRVVRENNKEDVLTGLEVLGKPGAFPIYMIAQMYGNNYMDTSEPEEMTPDAIKRFFFEFPVIDWPDYDTCMERIHNGKVVMLVAEDENTVYYLGIDKDDLLAKATETENNFDIAD